MLPRASAKFIAEHSKHAKVSLEGVKRVAHLVKESFHQQPYSTELAFRKQTLNPKEPNAAAIDWIFLVDTLNFSFWSDDETNKTTISYGGKPYTGYWALCAAVNKALDAGIPITSAKYMAEVNEATLSQLFQSDSGPPMPMVSERTRVVNEAGSVLLDKFNGSFVNAVLQAEKSAEKLLKTIVDNLSSYRDEATYQGQQVYLYKRAQILIGDIWACFDGQGLGEFHDINSITVFADYRVPQVLLYYGALTYSDSLRSLLDSRETMNSGDEMEVELRGCTIHACELICEEAVQLLGADGKELNSILLDHFLWNYRRDNDKEMDTVPFHRVRCIYY